MCGLSVYLIDWRQLRGPLDPSGEIIAAMRTPLTGKTDPRSPQDPPKTPPRPTPRQRQDRPLKKYLEFIKHVVCLYWKLHFKARRVVLRRSSDLFVFYLYYSFFFVFLFCCPVELTAPRALRYRGPRGKNV